MSTAASHSSHQGSADRLVADVVEITRTLRLLAREPDDIIEIRAIGSATVIWQCGAEHLDAAAMQAAVLSETATGIYVVMNQIRRDFLPINRQGRRAGKNQTVKGADIIRRRIVLLDFDRIKTPDNVDFSATDLEKAAAYDLAIKVRNYLRSEGWPEPVLADSGNGWHLLYLIDLPADDGKLVGRCLAALKDRFPSTVVEIDQRVKDAPRICKLYGTPARKGLNTPERPHRLSRIVEMPETLEAVPGELLEALADEPAMAKRQAAATKAVTRNFALKVHDPREHYVESAVNKELAILAAAPKGSRNDQLNKSSFALGQFVGAGVVGRGQVENLLAAAANKDLSASEVMATIRSGLDAGIAQPRDLSAIGLKAARDESHSSGQVNPNGHRGGNGKLPPVAEGPCIAPKGRKPFIVIDSVDPSDGLGKWSDATLDALRLANDPPRLFQRAEHLTRLRGGGDEEIRIETLSQDALRGELDRSASYAQTRVNKKGEVVLKWGPPPIDVVRDFAALPGWPPNVIPHLDVIVRTPCFLLGGRLMDQPGYHADARLYYDPEPGLKIDAVPEKPSAREVEAAKALIFDEFLVDFPFADQASRANALALMIAPFVRPMIEGATPLHLVESPTPGTGKGKLAKMLAYPSIGPTLHSSPQKEDDAEWRKALTSTLMEGGSHVFFDNMFMPVRWTRDGEIAVPIDSGVLASALTEDRWEDRKLGSNENARPKIRCIWIGSGNNLQWSAELQRRISLIRLIADREKPEHRTGFKHDPIEAWARDNRASLAHACLLLCRNWIVQGQRPGTKPFGSYEAYARVMGGILDAAGVAGFLDNQVEPSAGNDETQCWPKLVRAWAEARGESLTVAADLFELIQGSAALKADFVDILGDGDESSKKKRMGKALSRNKDRIWAGHRIELSAAVSSTGNNAYRLKAVAATSPVSQEIAVIRL